MNSLTVCGRDFIIEGSALRTARLDGEKYKFIDNPASIVEGLKKAPVRVDLFTFMQRLPETTPQFSYPMEWDNFAALPISTFDEWWTKQIGFKARNKAKQAEKRGVTLKEIPFNDELIHGICEIYNETPVRQGKRFPHYGMTLEEIRRYAGTFLSESFFIGAFFEDKLIGFAKLTVNETGTQAGLMHILSMVSHRDKVPTNGLLVQAVRSCAERHIGYLVYANFAYGKKERDSLSDFKERNGFKRIEIPRYYVPLSPVGWAAFRLGLHHKWTYHVPESWMVRLRSLRSSWYSRTLQTSTEGF